MFSMSHEAFVQQMVCCHWQLARAWWLRPAFCVSSFNAAEHLRLLRRSSVGRRSSHRMINSTYDYDEWSTNYYSGLNLSLSEDCFWRHWDDLSATYYVVGGHSFAPRSLTFSCRFCSGGTRCSHNRRCLRLWIPSIHQVAMWPSTLISPRECDQEDFWSEYCVVFDGALALWGADLLRSTNV